MSKTYAASKRYLLKTYTSQVFKDSLAVQPNKLIEEIQLTPAATHMQHFKIRHHRFQTLISRM